MIEIPESMLLARQINETLVGRRIETVIANASPHGFAWFWGEPAEYEGKLKGKHITKAVAYAGQPVVYVEDMRMWFSDGARPRYYAAGDKMPKKHQLFLQFDDGSALAVSVQMYGCLKVATEQEMQTDGYLAGQRLKPFVLSDAFTFSYFQSLVNEKTPKLSAKAFLATEQRIPGLGNGVLQDILFAAGVHPQRKMADVTSEEFANMYHAVKKVLKEMVDSGGRDVEKDLFGHPGGYKTILSQNTVHMPCHICGTPIQKKAYLGGAIYYCPVCQK